MSETKESFCSACVSGITALIGAGSASLTAEDRKKNKKTRKIIFWISVIVTVISILLTIYFLFIRKCNTCQ